MIKHRSMGSSNHIWNQLVVGLGTIAAAEAESAEMSLQYLRAGKAHKLKHFFLVAKKWSVGTPFFQPPNSPKKSMWVTFLRSFPENKAH